MVSENLNSHIVFWIVFQNLLTNVEALKSKYYQWVRDRNGAMYNTMET